LPRKRPELTQVAALDGFLSTPGRRAPPSGPEARVRARDLGLVIGRFAAGPYNAITDVAGVRVGHSTIVRGSGKLRVGRGPVRTGVTAILPDAGNIFLERLTAGAFVLNGAGEISGLTQVVEWGLIETPILLTNTLSVGTCSAAAVKYMLECYPGIGSNHDVVIPLVGECDDSWLNDVAGGHVQAEHAYEAIRAARSGPVAEGSVGGGTGMLCCDFKAGIGTSSRVLSAEQGGYTVGVLVMTNFGHIADLRMGGVPVGSILAPKYASTRKRAHSYGSIITIVATDAPLQSDQLGRLAKRAALGIGRTGSYAAHGSGEIILAFSTANKIPRVSPGLVYRMDVLIDQGINPLYEAVIDATEEAILNALCMATDMSGVNGNFAPALPLAETRAILDRYLPRPVTEAAPRVPPARSGSGRRSAGSDRPPPAPSAARSRRR
jgi:D-aminopeptidase